MIRVTFFTIGFFLLTTSTILLLASPVERPQTPKQNNMCKAWQTIPGPKYFPGDDSKMIKKSSPQSKKASIYPAQDN